MYDIIELDTETINQAAEFATALWPDCMPADMITHYSKLQQSGEATCFFAKDQEIYCGFVELSVRSDYVEGAEDLPVAYIEGIFVREAYRHKGIGILLINHAEKWARNCGFRQLCSDADMENERAINFHNAAGFAEVSRNVCFVKNLD